MRIFRRVLIPAIAVLSMAACATRPALDTGGELDAVAEAYVKATLAIGEREAGYVDAYHGPQEWADEAAADDADLAAIAVELDAIRSRLDDVNRRGLDPMATKRARFLDAHLGAAAARVRMLQGENFSFDAETQALYNAIAPAADYAALDATLAEIAALVPGDGALSDRVDAFLDEFTIPADRLDVVMRAAIDECRSRAAPYVNMPANERFSLEFVTDKPWSGYNWFQGDGESLIQVNTDFPIRLSRAIDLACHEGYPGHHAYNALLEQDLADARGWVEFTVFPLFSPSGLMAEGTANYGIRMAFPGDEALAFEREVLAPLAGLQGADMDTYWRLRRARAGLWPARVAIARDYLDGRISREEAVVRAQRYQLVSPERADQSIRFSETYRGYIINYGLGQAMVAAYVERVGGDDPDARWAAFVELISTPMVPTDLVGDLQSAE